MQRKPSRRGAMPAPVLHSTPMRELDRMLRAIAPRDVTVTLVGESGTGKEILARRVHDLSDRRQEPFVPINCAAIPEMLFESELFGHERGAFTGANARSKGKIEAAQRGTLFLDEIGEMPLPMQAKLLRFVENRRYMRVGGTTKIEADVRLVIATHRPLDADVASGRFRADLFYRIQGITLNVPPLRERRADIAAIVAQLVDALSAKHGTEKPRLGRAVKQALHAHAWPGNVRELKSAIEVLCLLRAGKQARLCDLPASIRAHAAPTPSDAAATTLTVSLSEPLDKIVAQIFDAALSLEGGHRGRAAGRLGVSVRTIQRYVTSESGR